MQSPEANDFLKYFGSEIANLKAATSVNDLLKVVESSEVKLSSCERDPNAHAFLGEVYRSLVESRVKAEQLQEICTKIPASYNCFLICARLWEVEGNSQKAFNSYLQALKTANSKGFWLNEASCAPWARPFVSYAIKFCEEQRRIQSENWLGELQKNFSASELKRIEKAIKVFTGEIPANIEDSSRKPLFFYMPELPSTPVFSRESMPYIEEYERRADSILFELNNVLNTESEIPTFDHTGEGKGLTEGGDWNAFFLYRHGKPFRNNLDKCPKTKEALDKLPLCRVEGQSPEVCFSILQPKTQIKPHTGVTNVRSVLHLGLIAPDDCALNIRKKTKLNWASGKAFAFDDTFEHEAWNNSDSIRVVMLADVWNPNLTEVERLALAELIPMMSSSGNA